MEDKAGTITTKVSCSGNHYVTDIQPINALRGGITMYYIALQQGWWTRFYAKAEKWACSSYCSIRDYETTMCAGSANVRHPAKTP